MNSDVPTRKKKEIKSPRIVLADAHVCSRQALGMLLAEELGLEVVGHASGGCEALEVCRAVKPDLVMLELELRDLTGLHVMCSLRTELPGVKVVFFTGSENLAALRAALAAEPDGFVRKSDELADLQGVLLSVVAGGRSVSPKGLEVGTRRVPSLKDLTERELAVLELVAAGLLTKEIADVLGMRKKTVDHHRQHIMDKLGFHDLASLMVFWMKHRG